MKKPVYKTIYSALPDGDARGKFADAEWKELCADLESRGQLTEQRKRLVDRLVRERVEFEFLFPDVVLDGPVKKGPKGGEYFSYEWSALQKMKDQILKLEESLKITVGKAEEPDKKPAKKAPADKYLARLGSN